MVLDATTSSPPARPGLAWRTPTLVVGLGLLTGVLTSVGQQYLPEALLSLANSSTSWSVVAFGLAWTTHHWWTAVVVATGTFVLLLAGYEIASEVKLGFGMSASTWLLWLVLASAAGPVLGVTA